MPTYDSMNTPSQLGGDLNIYSSGGWPNSRGTFGFDFKTYWDGLETTAAHNLDTNYAANLVDMCLHQRELHVVWVEPQWNGSARDARGPFVKKWNGSAWVAVGGEIQPSLQASPIRALPAGNNNHRTPPYTNGTVYMPGRPRIVSDGVNIYVGYTARVVENSPNADIIPAGAYVGDGYGTTYDGVSYKHWYTRWAFVRKWTGSSWSLYGQMKPYSFNTWEIGNSSETGYYSPKIRLVTSEDTPGIVFLGAGESGWTGEIQFWTPTPTFFVGFVFGDEYIQGTSMKLSIGRFDGSDVNGTITDLNSYYIGPRIYDGSTVFRPYTEPDRDFQIYDDGTDDPIVFYTKNSNPDAFRMQRLSGTVLQTFNDPGTIYPTLRQTAFGGITLNQASDLIYLVNQSYIRQVPADGSAPFETLDSPLTEADTSFPRGNSISIASEDSRHELWSIDYTGQVYMYHHNCPGWTVQPYGSGNLSENASVGEPVILVKDGIVYIAGSWASKTDITRDLQVKVFSATICRNCQNCGLESLPGPLNLHLKYRAWQEGDLESTPVDHGVDAGDAPVIDIAITRRTAVEIGPTHGGVSPTGSIDLSKIFFRALEK